MISYYKSATKDIVKFIYRYEKIVEHKIIITWIFPIVLNTILSQFLEIVLIQSIVVCPEMEG